MNWPAGLSLGIGGGGGEGIGVEINDDEKIHKTKAEKKRKDLTLLVFSWVIPYKDDNCRPADNP